MMQLVVAKMAESNLVKSGTALLLISLGSACSSSSQTSGSTAAGGPNDAGSSADGANVADDGSAPAAGAGSTVPVNLGTAANYVILAKSGISSVPTSAVTGDLGVSPAAATYITGFSLAPDSTKVFSTSSQVTGHVFASDYMPPTPSNLTTAVGDMQLAFTDAASRPPNATELGAGNLGGRTLTPGVYKWSSAVRIPTNVTLTGGVTDVWILQIAGNLTISSATSVVLTGGAVSKNVFWQVAGSVDLGTTAHFAGVILTKTSITLKTGASINGRLFAQTAVSIDDSAVVEP